MKKEKKPLAIDDEFTVDFIKNEKGGKPICRVEGKVAFIDNSVKSFVAPCSTWIVRVLKITENFLTVEPLVKIRTPKENQVIFERGITLIREKNSSHREKCGKIKKHFKYLTFQELKELKNKTV